MRKSVFFLCIAAITLTTLPQASAGSPWWESIKAAGKWAGVKSLQTGTREAAEMATKRAAVRAAREASEAAAKKSAGAAARFFGDDALRAGAKLAGSKGVSMVDDFAKVSSKLSPQNQRRLMMLAPDLQKSGQTSAALGLFSKGGTSDEVMEMLWRHRGKIAAGAAVTGIVVHGDSIVEAATEHIAKPFAEVAASEIVKPMAGQIRAILGVSILAAMIAVPIVGYWLSRRFFFKATRLAVALSQSTPSLN